MPARRVVDQRGGGGIGAVAFAEIAHLGFDLLPPGVLLVELPRQIAGARGVRGQEQLDRGLGGVHAAGGIEARGDAESHLAGGGNGAAGEARHIEQRAQAGIANVAQTGKAEGLTMMRFSPVSGTTSATVAMAASFRNDSDRRRSLAFGPALRVQTGPGPV